ncbi:MAG TPA: lysozyme [Streptosporangiaceae bacterium]|nr:lysozyme [Streptosporangiaceae bacterium]
MAAAGCGIMVVAATGQLGIVSVAAAPAPVVRGLDVSDHQASVNWSAVRSDGAQFAYVKATEGTGYVNPDFASQYDGSYEAGLIRGAYHFALPNNSSGAAQANYFVANGGGWSDDGRTLPGALDIEGNPYGPRCYRLSRNAMVSWIASFDQTYHALTSRWPVIYTNSHWWATCVGGYRGFASEDPLWLASFTDRPGPLPAGWAFYTFSQFADAGTFPGDQDLFNGSSRRLLRLATGG